MRDKGANPDAVLARIAARQHGVVSIEQALRVGISKHAVSRRVAAGRLHRVHRGVYALGHAGLSNKGRWKAAILAFPEEAVLSHRSAAALWELLPPTSGPTDVTIHGSGGRKNRANLRIHRTLYLPRNAVISRDRIAVTTPARTLTDLRRVVEPREHRRAVRQAEFLGLPLGDIEHDGTRSDLERDFLALCRRHRLPKPEVNVRIGPHRVDFLWRSAGLIVETDGWAAHRGRQAFEDDRARDLYLKRRGFEVVRVTNTQVTTAPAMVAAFMRVRLAPK